MKSKRNRSESAVNANIRAIMYKRPIYKMYNNTTLINKSQFKEQTINNFIPTVALLSRNIQT